MCVCYPLPADSHRIAQVRRSSIAKVFAILNDKSSGLKDTYVCSINIGTGVVTNIGKTNNLVDGIAWVPANYFGG